MDAEDGATIEFPDAILLSSGQELSGVVVDPDGKPVLGITVSASLASGGRLSSPRPRERNSASPWTETDEKGHFHLTNLPDEPISLMACRRNPVGGRVHYPSSLLVELNGASLGSAYRFNPNSMA